MLFWFNGHILAYIEPLEVKGLDKRLKKTFDYTVKIVNFIKQSLTIPVFGVLYDEMGGEQKQLLLHCKVR